MKRLVVLKVGPQHLDGHGPIEERLAALVDHAHAAVAEDFEYLQVADPGGQLRGGRKREGRSWKVPRRRDGGRRRVARAGSRHGGCSPRKQNVPSFSLAISAS